MAFLPFGNAQLTHTGDGVIDQAAADLIKKAAAKMSGTVSFTVTVVGHDSERRETFRQSADVLYKAPRYRVLAGSLEIYCDGKSVWQLNKMAKEVVVTPLADSDDDLTNPARLLANYSKHFRAKFIREEDDGTAIVDLQPNKTRSYHKVRLYIDKNGNLSKLEQHNYDASRSEYVVGNFKKASAADADFAYNPQEHAGIEIIDMR